MNIKKSYKVYLTNKNHLDKTVTKYLLRDVKFDKDKNIIETLTYAKDNILINRTVDDLTYNDFYYEDFLFGFRSLNNSNFDEKSRLIEEIEFEYDLNDNFKTSSVTTFWYDDDLLSKQIIIQENQQDAYLFFYDELKRQKRIISYSNDKIVSTVNIIREDNWIEHITFDSSGIIIERKLYVENKSGKLVYDYDAENKLKSYCKTYYDSKKNLIRALYYDGNKKIKKKEEFTYNEDNLYLKRVSTEHTEDAREHTSNIFEYVYEEV